MGDAAADCSAVADRPIGDAGRHLAQHLAPSELSPHVFDPGVGDAGADAPSLADIFDAREGVQARHVHQERGTREPQVQHGTERLTAGQELRAAPGPAQRGHCLVQVGRPYVLETRRLHASPTGNAAGAAARSIASNRRRGDSGVSVTSTPNGLSASLTALKMTAGGAIAPPSPMPLIPNSV